MEKNKMKLTKYMDKCEEIVSEYQDWLGIECSYDFPKGGYSFDKVPKD